MIKIFILTYKAPEELNANLSSLFRTKGEYEVHIINNHSEVFHLNEEFRDKVIVHHQTTRLNTGTGHPARDWNQALILGFKDLMNPDCEQIILCQDDAIWYDNWIETLDEIHLKYTFYTCGWGDCFMSFKPDAVQRIGLFDERFSVLGYQEGDYFLRAYIYNKENSSINDSWHNRVLNPTSDVAERYSDVPESRSPAYQKTLGKTLWKHKWGNQSERWTGTITATTPLCDSYILYPYFEKDIKTLKAQRFIYDEFDKSVRPELTEFRK